MIRFCRRVKLRLERRLFVMELLDSQYCRMSRHENPESLNRLYSIAAAGLIRRLVSGVVDTELHARLGSRTGM
jgi:hypothetical protein